MGLFLFVAFLVLAVIGTTYVVAHFMRKGLALKEGDMSTPLHEFRETHAVSRRVSSSKIDEVQSIAGKYELMCVRRPLEYKGSAEIPSVVSRYKAIVSGEELDTEGRHIPSEYIDGTLNPDYARYISNQIVAHEREGMYGNLNFLRSERDRIERRGKEAELRLGFMKYMDSAGLPAAMTDGEVINENKLNTYTEKNWKDFVRVVKAYLKTYDEYTVHGFVSMFDDISTVMDADKMQMYSIYAKNQVPEEVLRSIVAGDISFDQACVITELVYDEGYTWEHARDHVLKLSEKSAEEDNLRDIYRKQTF